MKTLLCLLLLLLAPVTLCHATPQLRVGTVAWAGFSALNVAEAKGFWAEQGLEVHVTVYASNQEVNTALAEARIDVALDMIGSWIGLFQHGADLVILGECDWSFGGDKIIGKKNFDPARLRGERIGIYLNQPSVTFFLQRFLASNKLSLKDVLLVELDPKSLADGFIANRFSVIVNYDPQALRALEQGDGRTLVSSATYPGVIPEGFAALRKHWTALPAETKRRFWTGYVKAVKWAQDPSNWPEYQLILNRMTFPDDPDFSETELRGLVSRVSVHLPAKLMERNCPGGGLERYTLEIRQFLEANGELKRDFTPASLLDTTSFMEVISASPRY